MHQNNAASCSAQRSIESFISSWGSAWRHLHAGGQLQMQAHQSVSAEHVWKHCQFYPPAHLLTVCDLPAAKHLSCSTF